MSGDQVSGFNSERVVPWQKCDCCDEWICHVHSWEGAVVHVHDCACPPVDDWVDAGLDPYFECDRAKVHQMIAEG